MERVEKRKRRRRWERKFTVKLKGRDVQRVGRQRRDEGGVQEQSGEKEVGGGESDDRDRFRQMLICCAATALRG